MLSTGHGNVNRQARWRNAAPLSACLNSTVQKADCLSYPAAGKLSVLRFLQLLFIIIFAAALIGCQSFALPAIDPTGERIFLPSPNATTLNPLHEGGRSPLCFLPEPAFETPATPPPCVQGFEPGAGGPNAACPIGSGLHHNSGKRGQIMLEPMRVVAPVGGEVVLLAGICGDDGHLATKQPLEWMLAPGSVGTFIEVGDDSKQHFLSVLDKKPKVEKLGVDFARGRTSTKETLITRGSPSPRDDLQLRTGQTWLSVSSPSEGMSKITVLAPDSEIWDNRRLTASIYWVDAQWQFPPVQPPLPADQPATLITRVTRAEGLVPAEGWIVRYRTLDPELARFLPSGADVAEVRVDSNGQAPVQIQVIPGRSGTTVVSIEVIKPANADQNMPALTLGRGQTAVTWSAPQLLLRAFGPESGGIGQGLTYTASMANPGDLQAENTALTVFIPSGMTVLDVNPQPSQSSPSGLLWNQGALPPGRQLDVQVTLQAAAEADYNIRFEAVGAPNLKQITDVRTQIIQPTLNILMKPSGGVNQIEVGQTVKFEIDITNTGRRTIQNLQLLIESDSGLQHLETGDNTVRNTVKPLAPGQTANLGISYIVRKEGELCARLNAIEGSRSLGAQQSCIVGIQPAPKPPSIAADVLGPSQLSVGTTDRFALRVINNGQAILTNIQVVGSYDASLNAVQASEDVSDINALRTNGTLVWRLSELEPGASKDYLVDFEGRSPNPQAFVRLQVQSAEGVQGTDTLGVAVVARPAPTPTVPANPNPPQNNPNPPVQPAPTNPTVPDQPRTGGWNIDISDLGDPVPVGENVQYLITVTNNSNLPDRNMILDFLLPQGVEFVSLTSQINTPRVEFSPDQRVITMTAVPFVRAGETLRYTLRIKSNLPQEINVTARVRSDVAPQGVEDRESTTITPR